MTSFREFAEACQAIEKISSSIDTTNRVADLLKKVDVEELPIATHFIMSEVFPAWSGEQLGIGTSLLYISLSRASGMSIKSIESLIRTTGDIGDTALLILKEKRKNQVTFSSFLEEQPELSITEVYNRFKIASEASGKGSQDIKIKNLQFLFNSSTPREAKYISRLALEELRIGVGEGVVRDAIAKAFAVPADVVEHAFMVTNDLGIVAAAAKKGGMEALEHLGIEINRPIKMMLSQISPDIDADIREMGEAAIEWKFDGARVQIHKAGNSVTLFSRKLENVTNSLPDLVEIVRKHVKAESAILDGEAVAVDEDGKPRAFQEILKRFRRKYDVEEKALGIPIQLNLFDIMYLNGKTLIDLPLFERRKALESCVESSVEDSKSICVDKQVITGDLGVIDSPAFPQIVDRWDSRDHIPIDVEMFDFLREVGIDTIIAANKMDKVKENEYDPLLDEIAIRLGLEPPWKNWKHIIAPISAKKGDLKALKILLRDRLHEMKRDDLFKYI